MPQNAAKQSLHEVTTPQSCRVLPRLPQAFLHSAATLPPALLAESRFVLHSRHSFRVLPLNLLIMPQYAAIAFHGCRM